MLIVEVELVEEEVALLEIAAEEGQVLSRRDVHGRQQAEHKDDHARHQHAHVEGHQANATHERRVTSRLVLLISARVVIINVINVIVVVCERRRRLVNAFQLGRNWHCLLLAFIFSHVNVDVELLEVERQVELVDARRRGGELMMNDDGDALARSWPHFALEAETLELGADLGVVSGALSSSLLVHIEIGGECVQVAFDIVDK